MLAIIPAAFRRPGLLGQGPFLRRILTALGVGAQGEPMSLKLLRDVPFGAVVCLVGTNYINSANAQQTANNCGQSGSGARRQDQVR
jgi:hypothetical protein